MEKEKLQELCNQKNYPTYFTEDLIKLYPIMVNHGKSFWNRKNG